MARSSVPISVALVVLGGVLPQPARAVVASPRAGVARLLQPPRPVCDIIAATGAFELVDRACRRPPVPVAGSSPAGSLPGVPAPCVPGPAAPCPSWAARYDGGAMIEGVDEAAASAAAGSTAFVTGTSASGGPAGSDFATVAYDTAAGTVRWTARADLTAVDVSAALVVSGSRLVVAGTAASRFGVVAYDAATGAELWRATQAGLRADETAAATAAVAAPDGRFLYVTGIVLRGTDLDVVTVAYELATGRQLWQSRLASPNAGADIVWSAAISPDGRRLYLAGGWDARRERHWSDYLAVAYTLHGTRPPRRAWLAHYDGPARIEDVAIELSLSPDGSRLFVAGRSGGSAPPAKQYDYGTVAYRAADGRKLWARRVAVGNQPQHVNWASEIDVSPDGRTVVVAGTLSDGPVSRESDYRWGIYAYLARTGADRWGVEYDSPAHGHESPTDLVVTPGHVYVTGSSGKADPGAFRWITVDCVVASFGTATGTTSWVARVNPSLGNDRMWPVAAVVDPVRGHLVVTGTVWKEPPLPDRADYATVAFAIPGASSGGGTRQLR